MTTVAVIAHSGKSVGGGLPELRRVLARNGVTDPLWAEVPKSKKAPKQVRRLMGKGAEHFVVWGGDGMAQRCIDTLAGSGRTMAIIPAGTANLLASNLGIPKDIEGAVTTALHGAERRIDVARMNGEGFAVMAGAGFDAGMIGAADGALKDRLGRAAYLWTGAKSMRMPAFEAHIDVEGAPWYDGPASCILAGNVGALFAGVEVFADATPDDGRLDLAVITADGLAEWARTVARTVAGSPERSPFFRVTQARKAKVKLDRKVPYELDGGARSKVKSYRLRVEPGAIAVRVPTSTNTNGGGR
ncbi:MAG TPA: diacylglycerol kinase family protein [Gaiellales bacterium]|nr:diacylglycerol kinase family protein [Gaiellales bacterium]